MVKSAWNRVFFFFINYKLLLVLTETQILITLLMMLISLLKCKTLDPFSLRNFVGTRNNGKTKFCSVDSMKIRSDLRTKNRKYIIFL